MSLGRAWAPARHLRPLTQQVGSEYPEGPTLPDRRQGRCQVPGLGLAPVLTKVPWGRFPALVFTWGGCPHAPARPGCV